MKLNLPKPALSNSDISLKKCAKCGVFPEFVIIGGFAGYYIRCPKCGRGTKVYQSSEISVRELAKKLNENYGG